MKIKLLFISIFTFTAFHLVFAQAQLGQDLQGLYPNNFFGYSVAMSADGNRVAIGAPRDDAGYVTVYEFQQGSWVQMGDTLEGKEEFAFFVRRLAYREMEID